MDGLLGVAGMIIVMKWIIPENAHQIMGQITKNTRGFSGPGGPGFQM